MKEMLLALALSVAALAHQVPLQMAGNSEPDTFRFKEGSDVFSPKDMLELPRPQPAIANPSGDLALIAVSKFSFSDKKTKKYIFVASLNTSVPPAEVELANAGETFWLDPRTIAHVASDEGSKGQQLYALSVNAEAQAISVSESHTLIGSFPPGASTSDFQYSAQGKTLVFGASVYGDRDLHTVKKQDEEYADRGNTARVYDKTYPRHWDTWRGPKRVTLFTTSLAKNDEGKWELGTKYTAPLDAKHHVPVEPFGGSDDYSLGSSHIVYTTKDPELPEAMHTRQNVYIVPFDGSSPPKQLTSGKQGATHYPIISHSGNLVAWLEMAKDGYESDRSRIVLYDLEANKRRYITEDWDRSPDGIAFSTDDKTLYLSAGSDAHVKLFSLPVPSPDTWDQYVEVTPTLLVGEHLSTGLQPLPDGRLLFTQNSLTSPNEAYVLSDSGIAKVTDFSSKHLQGKTLDQGESFWFEGAKNRKVQGWAIRPKGFKAGEKKAWPVLMLIHGGPQGAWEDSWSTRWNPNVFAQQGYFVIAINPTGSTTFGQEFTDAIAGDWGGAPFVDLQKGWKYALEKYPEIDPDRAVAAGASWGGYAINWIQGHPEYEFGFKALVCHDGVFDSQYNGFSTDELFFFNHDFGGPPWSEVGKYNTARFSPANFVANWSTPELLIHGSKDYRLAETESLGAFNALQQKGIPSRLVVFPDENHWVLKPGNSLKWHYEVFRWFDQWI